MIISCDAGRSACKFVWKTDKFHTLRIPSVFTYTNQENLKNSFIKQRELIVSFPWYKQNQIMVMGLSALDYSNSTLLEVIDIEEFIKSSVFFALGGITEIIKSDEEEITLIMQLTINDLSKFGSKLKNSLTGTKQIIKYDSFGNIIKEFNLKLKCEVYMQGLSSFFDLLFTDNGEIDNKYYNSKTLVIDPGAITTDVSLVNKGKVPRAESFNIGSNIIYTSISDDLRKEGIEINPKQIEWQIINNDYIVRGRKQEYNIKEMMEKYVENESLKLLYMVDKKFGKETFKEIILTGGGSKVFYDKFKESWQFATQPNDPQFSNSKGALKYFLYQDKLLNL